LDENTLWELREYQGNLIPYVEVRNQLWARVSRHVFYQMVEQAEIISRENRQNLVIVSNGKGFSLGEYQEA
jgi:uncharacterized protein